MSDNHDELWPTRRVLQRYGVCARTIDRWVPGSVNAAIVSYYASKATFQTLAPSTQMLRRVYLESFREKYGKNAIASMRPEFVVQMIDRMTPSSAHNWLRAIRGLIQHALATGLCKTDPTQGVKLPKLGGSIHTWTEEEIAKYQACHLIGTKARLALELALGTAQRRNDLLRMGRQHLRNGELFVRQSKTKAELLIPISKELMAILNAPWAAQGSLSSFSGSRMHAPRDRSDYRPWTLKEVERYTKAADQVRLARQAAAKRTKRDE
jgi:integrase